MQRQPRESHPVLKGPITVLDPPFAVLIVHVVVVVSSGPVVVIFVRGSRHVLVRPIQEPNTRDSDLGAGCC